MAVARELFQALEILSTATDIPPRAAAMIGAHALECTLHAFLFHRGVDASRDSTIWHHLDSLWSSAHKEGLAIPASIPDWVSILSAGHDRPFYLRYQKGEGGSVVNGGQTPALIPMTIELRKVIAMVELAVKG